ncbi:Rad52/Rad22 family DNA repair protein [Fusobacteria bacterium ZRK30]|nr:Rad52/Rad22 family DNA repair protein [Fusobacteria bacterium ZRK30]
MDKSIEIIIQQLKEPFVEDQLEFKVGATNKDKTMGLALAYVEARSIQDRLDEVVGFNSWKVSYREVKDGFLCSLSLRINNEWISKEDGAQLTDYEFVKGGISSAFKRVASSGFGIGRYLYGVRNQWFPIVPKGKGYDFAITPIIDFKDLGTISKSKNTKPITENPKDRLQRARLMKLTFGKYSGKTLGEIFENDRRYFDYLKDKGQDPNLINACKYLETLMVS